MGGWIKIHRDIQQHWIAQDMQKLGWWVDMLLLASYEENKAFLGNHVVEIKRGQFIASLRFFADRWKVSKDRVNAFLRLLTQEGMILKESDKNTTLITICNYESYQDVCDTSKTPSRHLQDTFKTPPRQTKEIQEIKEYISTSTAPAHTRESDFIRRYREEGMWSDTAVILHQSITECESLFDRWIIEYQHKGQTHQDYSDFKKHFIQWARVAISKESKQNSNGNQRKYDDRRGTEVNTSADYTKPL